MAQSTHYHPMRLLQLSAICAATLLLAATVTVGAARWIRGGDPRPVLSVAATPSTQEPSQGDLCERRRRAILEQPALVGVPALEAARAELMARAKAEPVVFLEAPVAQAVPPDLAKLRSRLYHEGVPWQVLNDVFSKLKPYPQRLRQVLLTDGYLYADKPDLAALLASGIVLSQIFTERELDITRGCETRHAQRKHDDYVWTDGPEAGQPARLWLFDRISVHGEPLSPNKHAGFGNLPRRLGTTRIEIERLTSEAGLVTLFYGEPGVPAVFSLKDGCYQLECEVVRPEAKPQVQAARNLGQRHERVMERLRAAIGEQIEEGLPFDEPKTEEGQQDGKLRQEWRTAYLQGRFSYEFNGDQYPVFGPRGVPRVPQVCVDFITDSWERMAGTRWLKRDEARERRVGLLDFDAINIENRRSVENLVDFAAAHPDWFELMIIPESERVVFARRADFFRRLFELRTDFQPGDVVAILGPRDDEKLHYHSFFIVESDPITAMPTWLAANAGRPRIRTWEGEMQNAPRRSIMARIRPRLEWLEAIVGPEGKREPS
jgi:hypothetical protein